MRFNSDFHSFSLARIHYNTTFCPGLRRRYAAIFACITVIYCVWAAPLTAAEDLSIDDLNRRVTDLYENGRYVEARKLGEDVLRINEAFYTSNHVHSAFAMNNLAGVYKAVALYDRSEGLYKQVIRIYEKHYGAGHVEVAAAMNNLAALYLKLGRLTKAQILFSRSSSVIGRQLSPHHPVYARSLSNVAELHRVKGELDKAEAMQKRAVAIRTRYLGAHSDTANSMQNLGRIYADQRDYSSARRWQEKALNMRRQIFSEDHADLGASYHYLAELDREEGRFDESETHALRALELRKKSLGENHPEVAETLMGLASLYRAWQKNEEAEKISAQWQEIARSSPSVIFIRENLKSTATQHSPKETRAGSEAAVLRGEPRSQEGVSKGSGGMKENIDALQGDFAQGRTSGSVAASGREPATAVEDSSTVVTRIDDSTTGKEGLPGAEKPSWLQRWMPWLSDKGVRVAVSGKAKDRSPMKPEESISDLEKRVAELEKSGRRDDAEVMRQLIRKMKRLQAQT